jgi:hypothetical protein
MPEGIKRIFQTSLTDTATTDLEEAGTLRWEGNKVYKWVRYSGATGEVPAVVGWVCGYKASQYDPSGAAESTVTCDHSSTRNIGAGVHVSVIPELGFGWIQIKGPATVALTIGDAGQPTVQDGVALGIDESGVGTGVGDGSLAWCDNVTNGSICAFGDDVSAKTIICDFTE